MVDVVNKKCTLRRRKGFEPSYEGHCLRCFINLFPDKPVVRNYKTKDAVYEYIKAKFPDIEDINDKIISGGCSKKRPDFLMI